MEKSKNYKLPSTNLLKNLEGDSFDFKMNNSDDTTQKILDFAKSKKLNLEIKGFEAGPTYTRFYTKLGSMTKYSDIIENSVEMAIFINSPNGNIFISAPIPGTDTFGIDVPNERRSYISLRRFLENMDFTTSPKSLNIPLGLSSENEYLSMNLAQQPHLLISGAVNGGKSTYLNTIINTLLIKTYPEEVKLILIDPKRVEFNCYSDLPNLLCPIIYDPENAVKVLSWLVDEMKRRYELFDKTETANIDDYNSKEGVTRMPNIIFIVDEFSEVIVLGKSVEKNIVRLAQLSRATGIHLILCTQRPSPDILTGLIRANIGTRMAFSTVSYRNSLLILGQKGAEKLLGKGDMLYSPSNEIKLIHVQAPNIELEDIKEVVEHIRGQAGIEYDESLMAALG